MACNVGKIHGYLLKLLLSKTDLRQYNHHTLFCDDIISLEVAHQKVVEIVEIDQTFLHSARM